MIREPATPALSEPCDECGRTYIHAMTCSNYPTKIAKTPEETVPMTQVSDPIQPAATGECSECGWFGGHDTTCSKFVNDDVTLDGTTGAVVEPTVTHGTVDGVDAVIKNITPEPKLPMPSPTVDDAIETLIRTQVTLQTAIAVTTRAKATQKVAQDAVDTAVLAVIEAHGESHKIVLPFEATVAAADEDEDDADDESNDGDGDDAE